MGLIKCGLILGGGYYAIKKLNEKKECEASQRARAQPEYSEYNPHAYPHPQPGSKSVPAPPSYYQQGQGQGHADDSSVYLGEKAPQSRPPFYYAEPKSNGSVVGQQSQAPATPAVGGQMVNMNSSRDAIIDNALALARNGYDVEARKMLSSMVGSELR